MSVAPLDRKKAFTNSGASLAPMVLDPWIVKRGSAKDEDIEIEKRKTKEKQRKGRHNLCIQYGTI
jgi:hypothetical protein